MDALESVNYGLLIRNWIKPSVRHIREEESRSPYDSDMNHSLADERAQYSRARLATLRDRISTAMNDVHLEGLTIFTAGSFARLEGSQQSDIDLWFTYHPSGRGIETRRVDEAKLFTDLKRIAHEMDFPDFSNDGLYLRTHNTEDVLKHLGSPADDAHNHFTLRMLLLLESRPVYGDVAYESVLREIISSYYRDYPKHQEEFQPWFLMNDIMRFWKTLLLNYEHRRNRPSNASGEEQRIKNFKLKFSRMTTCFATLAALGTMTGPVSEEDVFELVLLTPLDRLRRAATNLPECAELVDSVLAEYSWFIELTGLPKVDLYKRFAEESGRREMFARADAFGSTMFKLLTKIDEVVKPGGSGLLRVLVI